MAMKYPVVLVHGIAIKEKKYLRAFGWIAEKMRDEGYEVYIANTDAFGSIKNNSTQLKEHVLRILEKTGAKKINLIGHSKGGLDSKEMITSLGMEDKVASLTTLCTPHKGSIIASKIWSLPMPLKKMVEQNPAPKLPIAPPKAEPIYFNQFPSKVLKSDHSKPSLVLSITSERYEVANPIAAPIKMAVIEKHPLGSQ